ncbi:phytoene desaturase family protein [Nocardioides limicola]|uniref:phytoene desaturase family protein n=1 Tax=Nocardioides limicola TaxID=2803368 RepID=UPI00193B8CBE|nr:FAD-dependent oxidoreductase [Nocardioides sp. DJM-14]
MARVTVIGGGFGGLASAARLAKLGHEVTLVERLPTLGGALDSISARGFTWDTGPTTTLLPGVVRDLFRKSGRQLDAELDLVAVDLIREHRFADGSSVRLPGGSRGVQYDAFEELEAGLGDLWCDYVASFADDWDLIRRDYLERPLLPETTSKQVQRLLRSRESVYKRLRKTFRDPRLRQVAAYPFVLGGHDPRNVPAWMGMHAYVEQRFGAWTIPGGMVALRDALAARLETRKVRVLTETTATDVVLREGAVVAVATDSGPVDTDVVVCAIDPRRLPVLARHVARTMPAIPPVVCHLGLDGEIPELTSEVVLHGDAELTVRPGGRAPEGGAAWTVLGRGRLSEDILNAMARQGLDVRRHLVTRIDRSPKEQAEHWAGSPMGVLWQGRSTVTERVGPATPVPGVYAAGAHATPGAGIPFVGLSAALVAEAIGPAR